MSSLAGKLSDFEYEYPTEESRIVAAQQYTEAKSRRQQAKLEFKEFARLLIPQLQTDDLNLLVPMLRNAAVLARAAGDGSTVVLAEILRGESSLAAADVHRWHRAYFPGASCSDQALLLLLKQHLERITNDEPPIAALIDLLNYWFFGPGHAARSWQICREHRT